MNLLLKNRTRGAYLHRCAWGCCDDVHGKGKRKYRRAMKRRERMQWKKEV